VDSLGEFVGAVILTGPLEREFASTRRLALNQGLSYGDLISQWLIAPTVQDRPRRPDRIARDSDQGCSEAAR
jgi:hypothetical protein